MLSEELHHNGGPRLSKECLQVLAEPVHFLDANAERLVSKWTELYLSAFGRKSFFSSERVFRIFDEMACVFLSSLKRGSFDRYFSMLEEKGRLFSGLGVPFEEVVLCLHLFEQAYVSLILDNKKVVKHNAGEIVLAFEELNNLSTAVFAASYFRTVKKDWQGACEGYREENQRLRSELETLHDEYLNSTKNELASMQTVIRGINAKLRRSVVRSRRVQMFTDILEKESNLKNLIRAADKFLRDILPPGSAAVFGLFDENQRKLLLSAREGDSVPVVFDEIYLSQVNHEFQESMFDERRGPVAFRGAERVPPFLAAAPRAVECSDFIFLPLRKFNESMGFLFLCSSAPDAFTRGSQKYYQRLGGAFARALFSLTYFNRHNKHAEFVSLLDQLDERLLHRNPLEATLDFCLGSMIDLLDVERASVMLLDKKTKTLSITAAKGYKVYPFSGLTLKWGEGVAGWSVKEAKIVSIPRMKSPRGAAFVKGGCRDEAPQTGVQSLLCVPLMHENEPLGVINLSTLTYHKNFEQSEIDMIQRFAQRITSALTSLATIKDFEALMKPYL